MAIPVLIGMVFVINWEMFHGRISLNSALLLLQVNFLSGFRLELMYISLILRIRTSITHLYGSVTCAAAIFHRNHFRLCQQSKCESKIKFRQANYHCKRVLEAAKLAYATKTKEFITSQKLGSWDFWRIANSILNKGKSAIHPLFNSLEVLSSASFKAKLFAETFLRTFILMTWVSLYLFSLLELVWNYQDR